MLNINAHNIYIYIYISFIYELIKVNIKSIRITKNDSICLTGRISISYKIFNSRQRF